MTKGVRDLEAVKSYLHIQQEGFESRQSSRAWRVICLILQIVVGAILLFSGLMKGIDPIGTAIKINEYAHSVGLSLPDWLSESAAVFLNVLEALLGSALLLGLMPRITSLFTLLLMGGMTLVTLYIVLYEPVSDCGCFGDALKISNSATFIKNIFLLLFALILWLKRSRWVRVLSDGADLVLVVVIASLLVHFNLYPLRHLPVVDFRPYKAGRSLEELTITGGREGIYEHQYIYTKDGAERAFGLEDLANIEEGWSFVRDETITIQEAVQPEGMDFVLIDSSGDNYVPHLIEEGAKALLLLTREPRQLHRKEIQRLTTLIQKQGLPLYVVSSQPRAVQERPEAQLLLQESRGLLFLDHTTSVTALRSDPGVMVISEGVIQNKLSLKDFLSTAKESKSTQVLFTKRSSAMEAWRVCAVFGPLGIFALVITGAGVIHRRQRKDLRGSAKVEGRE